MTNNFDVIEEYMIEGGIPISQTEAGNLFFMVLLVRRGKDHPNLPAANYTFKEYYIDSIEKFKKLQPEIIKCCDVFGLRAYVSVNVKSKETFVKHCALEFNKCIVDNNFQKPWSKLTHVFDVIKSCLGDRWIVDVDDIETEDIVDKVSEEIRKCESKYIDPIITKIKTRSGVHIITHPFNLQKFNQLCQEKRIDTPEIKKNNPTLLYERI